jgi:hypothetical protein
LGGFADSWHSLATIQCIQRGANSIFE